MIKKTITYVDYDGNERTEDFWFNLTKAELALMNFSEAGGLERKFEKISQTMNVPAITKTFEEIIELSYGEKSPDGRRFIKSKELFEEFKQTEAYSNLIIELLSNPKAVAEFANGIVPRDIAREMEKQNADNLTALNPG